jgi:hypothetical protein
MISVAVKGYGVIIWREADDWKAFGRSDRLAATLSTRVELALDASEGQSQNAARRALLSIVGATLLMDDRDGGFLPEG